MPYLFVDDIISRISSRFNRFAIERGFSYSWWHALKSCDVLEDESSVSTSNAQNVICSVALETEAIKS